MFCTARQTSQGTQRQYTASSIGVTEETYDANRTIRGFRSRAPQLQRQTNAVDGIDNDFQVPIIQHTMSDFGDTPYLTPQATQLMREISRPMGYIDEEEDDELSISTQEIN